MSKLYSLTFVCESVLGPIIAYWVEGIDGHFWSDNPDGLVVFDDFTDASRQIDDLIASYREFNPNDEAKLEFGTIRQDEPWQGENLSDAIVMTTPVGEVIQPGIGKLTTNEVDIKPVMYTSY